MNEGIAEQVRAAGGEIFAVSSEPQQLSDRAHSEWRLDFEPVGDPHHEIADDCRSRGWLDLYVNPRLGFLRLSTRKLADFEPTHPKGYFQPGVLAVSREGRVLYRWRGVPTHSNMGGAAERPTAPHVWSTIQASLASNAGDASLDEAPPLDAKGVPWPAFASLLIANGWFVRPLGFRSRSAIAPAALRLAAFIAAWVAGFALLPMLPVALALVGWLVYIAPKVQWLGREFQHVAKAETPESG